MCQRFAAQASQPGGGPWRSGRSRRAGLPAPPTSTFPMRWPAVECRQGGVLREAIDWTGRKVLRHARASKARLPAWLQTAVSIPHFKALKQKLDAGAIGALESLQLINHDPASPPPGFIPTSGGLFKDFTIHDLDMARWLLGEEPVQVYTTASCLVDPEIGRLGDVDTARTVLKTASGKLCVISNTRRSGYGYDQRTRPSFFRHAQRRQRAAGHAATLTETMVPARDPSVFRLALQPWLSRPDPLSPTRPWPREPSWATRRRRALVLAKPAKRPCAAARHHSLRKSTAQGRTHRRRRTAASMRRTRHSPAHRLAAWSIRSTLPRNR